MDSEWASQRLEQIRLLMDRSASYRRALAPTTLATGAIGIAASGIGWQSEINSPGAFVLFWICVALVTLGIALSIIRRQALQSVERFWSVPTRRIAEAMVPPFTIGLAISLIPLSLDAFPAELAWWLPSIWMMLYGCGLCSAGFFMPRGIKLFGAAFLLTGCLSLLGLIEPANQSTLPGLQQAHLVMGGAFGVMHLTYGLYLYVTETREEPL